MKGSIKKLFNISSAFGVSVARLGLGIKIQDPGVRPAEPLVLYEFEGCPYCRKVREMLSALDIDVIVYPCPKNGPRYRPEAIQKTGKKLFPYLVDPNTGVEMHESADINHYLIEQYGGEKLPLLLGGNPIANASSMAATACRPLKGMRYREAQQPEKLLKLYSFEGSPYCRLVREVLCELELPYQLINVAKESPKRDEFIALSGKMMVPFLIDENTGVSMFESEDIVEYLNSTYAV